MQWRLYRPPDKNTDEQPYTEDILLELDETYTKSLAPFCIETTEAEFVSVIKRNDWIKLQFDEPQQTLAVHVLEKDALSSVGTSKIFIKRPDGDDEKTWNSITGNIKVAILKPRQPSPTQENKLDFDDLKFEIESILPVAGTSDIHQGELALIKGAGWSTMMAVQKALRLAAQDLNQSLQKKYDSDMQNRFENYLLSLQTDINQFYRQHFDPVSANGNGKGWVLLRPAQANSQKRLKLMLGGVSYVPGRDSGGPNAGTEFELLAGNIDAQNTSTEQSRIHQDPPILDISSFVTSKDSAIDTPSAELKLRLTPSESEISVIDADQTMKPFEHDLHLSAADDFETELKEAVFLVLSYIFGTTEVPSDKQHAAHFTLTRVPPTSQNYSKLVPDPVRMEYPIGCVKLMSVNIDENLTDYINSRTENPNQTRKGSCSEFIWKKIIKQASVGSPLPRDLAYDVLLNRMPIMAPNDPAYETCKTYTAKIAKNIVGTGKGHFMMKQTKEQYHPQYTPPILHYTFKCTDIDETSFTWCLGASPSLVLEALELALMILQIVVKDIPTEDTTFRHQYEDSLFSLDKVDSVPIQGDRQSRWSGFYGKHLSPGDPDKLLVLWESVHTGEKTSWVSDPMLKSASSSGIGVWRGIQPPTIDQIVTDRYMRYNGIPPEPELHKNPLLGPVFDKTILGTWYSAKEIPSKTVLTRAQAVMETSFVGWHYTNSRSFGRTVFALAYGAFYRKIKDFFEEPTLGAVFLKNSRRDPYTRFVKLVFEGQSKTRIDSMLVKPGIVTCKGPSPTHCATECEISDILVPTEFYNLMQGETWHVISYMQRQRLKPPRNAVPGCLSSRLTHRTHASLKELLALRPSIADALARLLMSVAQVCTERRIRPTEYRQIQLMNEGKNI